MEYPASETHWRDKVKPTWRNNPALNPSIAPQPTPSVAEGQDLEVTHTPDFTPDM